MKIISKYKDYYDYLAHTYGVDNNIVYIRDKLIPKEKDTHLIIIDKLDDLALPKRYNKRDDYSKYNVNIDADFIRIFNYLESFNRGKNHGSKSVLDICKLLVILDKVFIMCKNEKNEYKLLTKELFKKHCSKKENKYDFSFHKERVFEIIENYSNLIVGISENILSICEYLKAPIFTIHADTISTHIMDYIGNTPSIIEDIILSNTNIPLVQLNGIREYYPSDKLYQDIYNFFININKNADLLPPVEVDDKTKLLKNGFDSKISFRHPTKFKCNLKKEK